MDFRAVGPGHQDVGGAEVLHPRAGQRGRCAPKEEKGGWRSLGADGQGGGRLGALAVHGLPVVPGDSAVSHSEDARVCKLGIVGVFYVANGGCLERVRSGVLHGAGTGLLHGSAAALRVRVPDVAGGALRGGIVEPHIYGRGSGLCDDIRMRWLFRRGCRLFLDCRWLFRGGSWHRTCIRIVRFHLN